MICASCGANEMRPDVRDLKQTCKGRVNIIKDVHADWCDHAAKRNWMQGTDRKGKRWIGYRMKQRPS
jgi:YgiT-type zinc finger domain-containing protein